MSGSFLRHACARRIFALHTSRHCSTWALGRVQPSGYFTSWATPTQRGVDTDLVTHPLLHVDRGLLSETLSGSFLRHACERRIFALHTSRHYSTGRSGVYSRQVVISPAGPRQPRGVRKRILSPIPCCTLIVACYKRRCPAHFFGTRARGGYLLYIRHVTVLLCRSGVYSRQVVISPAGPRQPRGVRTRILSPIPCCTLIVACYQRRCPAHFLGTRAGGGYLLYIRHVTVLLCRSGVYSRQVVISPAGPRQPRGVRTRILSPIPCCTLIVACYKRRCPAHFLGTRAGGGYLLYIRHVTVLLCRSGVCCSV